METILDAPQGQFELQRLPKRKNEILRAWDAADEYLLQYVFENISEEEVANLLILNDSFGALAVALHRFLPTVISDSYLSQQATHFNLIANKLPEASVQLNDSFNWNSQPVSLVLIKVPKTMALLEDQLIRLQALITTETIVIASGMVKAMPATVWKLLEKYIGETIPSLAKKKARLIFASTKTLQKKVKNPYPVYYQLEGTEYRICNHANVFSRESLDIGTRFLLQHLPERTEAKNIVDLGCGNGVVGLMLARIHSKARLYFVDESYMAIESARETFQSAFKEREASFSVADGLTSFDNNSMDLIVCNPPFHQQNTVGSQIALIMFKHSQRILCKGGELRVIGNRHLGYHIELKKIFNNCEEIAANKKFVIWRVIK